MDEQDTNERVKVVVRVRPMNSMEENAEEASIVKVDVKRNEIFVTKMKKVERNPSHTSPKTEITSFTFDAVLDNSLTQNEIYEKVFKSLVDSVVNGYNATIFAYGQTGTGKTFTIEGSLNSEDTFGVMPNAFKHIFDQVANHRDKRYLIGASYFEIYQEEIRDLLTLEDFKKCVIHERGNGIHIKGLSSYLCSSFHEISELMIKGRRNRAVGSTDMNEHSSRSHAVFQIIIETSDQSDVNGEHIRVGKLNLVDLAGSERVSKTGAEGLRLKEATKINLSLSTLGNVISALVDGSGFIPYRNSKLTRILQDSLGGNSRTVMVATVGPAAYNYEETMNTLRYASRAKSIENKPRINENPKDAVLRRYQEEINRLRKMVEEKNTKQKVFNESTSPGTSVGEKRKKVAKSSSDCCQKGSVDMIDASRAKELREMLEQLGILFEGNIEDIRKQLKEKTENLEKNTLMLKEDKEKLAADLLKATNELQSAEFECNNLMSQITWLESKVLNSSAESQLLEKMQSQKAEIEEKEKELESHKARHDELRKALAEKQMTNEETLATFNAVENECNANVEKMTKIARKIEGFGDERNKIRNKHLKEVTKLRECIEEMTRELKLKKMMVDNFVPRKIRKEIDQRMRYDEQSESYFVEPPANAGLKPPALNKMLEYPLFNFTRFQHLKPMNNTFFTNENLLLLGPEIPHWPVKDFVPSKTNPKIESLVKNARKDMENAMIINCDHNANRFRLKECDSPTYVAVGPTILLRNVRSDKFCDFSCVPSDISLPSGSNICPLQIPPKTANGAKFTQEQLLAFPLIKYSGLGQLVFEENETSPQNHKFSDCSTAKQGIKEKFTKRRKNEFKEMSWTPSESFELDLDLEKMEYELLAKGTSPTYSPSLASSKNNCRTNLIVPHATPRSILKTQNKHKTLHTSSTSEQPISNMDLQNNNLPVELRPDEQTLMDRLKYYAARSEFRNQVSNNNSTITQTPHVTFNIISESNSEKQVDTIKLAPPKSSECSLDLPNSFEKGQTSSLDNLPPLSSTACGDAEITYYDLSGSENGNFDFDNNTSSDEEVSQARLKSPSRPPTRPTSQRLKEQTEFTEHTDQENV